jgi:hypothetical protein
MIAIHAKGETNMRTTGRSLSIAVLAVAAAMSVRGIAGEVYKCKGPHGEVTFTNIKCPDKTAAEHYGSYTKAPDAPPETEVPATDAPTTQPSDLEASAPVAAAPTAPRIAGYECEVDGKTWIQVSPCPATSTRVVFDDVDTSGMTDSGEFVHGSGTVRREETVPVAQQELDREAMCTRIAARANTSENGDNGPSASYERNRMREAVGCH